ncbi:DUF11 domain-containing protein [Spirosoma sordidisoli]|uniref:DUF11 domain-containing protein n=3 Tax=Spirosoma TaxID=107 RepID=A0A4Q2UIK9_9BACT|nr:DUF11 domain-containing protein [Spirosoma sordidisoli]
MVVQRNLYNEANILVAGLAPANATAVEARLVPLALGQGQLTAWTSLPFLATTKAFRGPLLATGGWYRLEVRAKNGSTLLSQTNVDRVGVGEVFVIAGQSNVYGGFQRASNSAEDRVSCVDFRQDSLSEQLLPLRFSRASYGSSIGPSQPPHIWSTLGDRLVQQLNVPVLFLGAALGGTSSSQWQQSAVGNIGPTQNTAVYRRLGVALLHYVSRTGARAVLWHQGESDSYTDTQTYFDNIRQVIEKSRQQTGFTLPWVMSRVSYINGQTFPNVIAAQNRLITELPAVFPGPATDSLVGSANRPDNIHLAGAGIPKFITTWLQSLTPAFFQQAQPYLPPADAPLITSGYTLPLARRPGETIMAASVRSNPQLTDNSYFVQLIRTSTGEVVTESARSTANPIPLTLPGNLPDGQYQFRTVSTSPALVGKPGEPFIVNYFATPTPTQSVLTQPVAGGSPAPILQRVGYRYETASHSFYLMVQATAAVEVRLERIDGGNFGDSGWTLAPPSSQAPDYEQFADFNYLRNYPPIAGGVGGVEPGRYRVSVRQQGSSGAGLFFETQLLNGRVILYAAPEPISSIPPVLNIGMASARTPCVSSPLLVEMLVEGGPMNSGNLYRLQLSDASGSFANPITLQEFSSAASNPATMSVPIPAATPAGNQYRLRITATNPAVSSAPSPYFSLCSQADLSLSMTGSSRTVAVGEPVTFTLTVANAGPASAADVAVQSLLPANVEIVEILSPAIRVTDQTLTASVASLPTGSKADFVFRLRPTQPGSYITTAQLTSSSAPDPDSQPNSGTGDGQDDTARLDMRTPDHSTSRFESPNPNQTPLPAVLPNQPAPDPTKADLNLSIVSDRLLMQPGQIVSVSITVTNQGGLPANSVRVGCSFPPSLAFLDSPALSGGYGFVAGTFASIAPGQSGTFWFRATATQAAQALVQAQIIAASAADPDSRPGNGYLTGEDDTASLFLTIPY